LRSRRAGLGEKLRFHYTDEISVDPDGTHDQAATFGKTCITDSNLYCL
jgi:hypothetical protein